MPIRLRNEQKSMGISIGIECVSVQPRGPALELTLPTVPAE